MRWIALAACLALGGACDGGDGVATCELPACFDFCATDRQWCLLTLERPGDVCSMQGTCGALAAPCEVEDRCSCVVGGPDLACHTDGHTVYFYGDGF